MKKADGNHLPYAIDEFGNLVSISDIPPEKRGLACGCHCVKCNEPLIAKLGYGGKIEHFSHQKDSDCHGAEMTLLHRLSEDILKREKNVRAQRGLAPLRPEIFRKVNAIFNKNVHMSVCVHIISERGSRDSRDNGTRDNGTKGVFHHA